MTINKRTPAKKPSTKKPAASDVQEEASPEDTRTVRDVLSEEDPDDVDEQNEDQTDEAEGDEAEVEADDVSDPDEDQEEIEEAADEGANVDASEVDAGGLDSSETAAAANANPDKGKVSEPEADIEIDDEDDLSEEFEEPTPAKVRGAAAGYDKDKVSAKVHELIADFLGVAGRGHITDNSKLFDDLHILRAQVATLGSYIGDEFDISIRRTESENFTFVRDIVNLVLRKLAL